jgi:hypothetical protein
VFDILRAAHAQQEDHQTVQEVLRSRRPGSVELNLTQEQYGRLKGEKAMDTNALLDVWKADEVPACDEGMRLAQAPHR